MRSPRAAHPRLRARTPGASALDGRRRVASAGAPVSATTLGPSNRSRGPVSVVSRPALLPSFPTSRLASRSDGRSAAPERGTPMCAQPGRPRSCTVVSAPGEITSICGIVNSDRLEPHLRPRLEQRRRVARQRRTAQRLSVPAGSIHRASCGDRSRSTPPPPRPSPPAPPSAASPASAAPAKAPPRQPPRLSYQDKETRVRTP